MIPSWRERAACFGMDPNYFNVLDSENKILEGLSLAERRDLQRDLFRIGLTFCSRCPVAQECGESGNELHGDTKYTGYRDSEYTIRGGLMPKRWTGNAPGRPRGVGRKTEERPIPDDAPDFCVKGHPADWKMVQKRKFGRNGEVWGRECRTCKAERQAAYYAARKSAKPSLIERHSTEHPDHEPDWELDSKGSNRCRTCRNAYQREYQAEMRAKARAAKDAAAGRPTGRLSAKERHPIEHSDHEPDWTEEQGRFRCRTCKKIRTANAKAARKAARLTTA